MSKLVFVSTKAKVDSSFYVTKIMYPSLVPFWYHSGESYGWTNVVEDGAGPQGIKASQSAIGILTGWKQLSSLPNPQT